MSVKSKVLSIASTLTLLGGIGAAGAMTPASAATPSCGSSCIDIFSKDFGTFHNPQFVMDVYKQKETTGNKIILFRESNSDPAEDFSVADQGTVSDFYEAGLMSSTLALHYGCGLNLQTGLCSDGQTPQHTTATDDFAFEVEYAPFGVDSGQCVGVASTAVSGEGVTLQPCGVSSKTAWVVDTLDSCAGNPLYFEEAPVINGSDTNFSHPFVAQYPATGYPTDSSRPQLTVANLTGFSQSGNLSACGQASIVGPDSNQLWAAYKTGVLP
jgi:hypothetical protein